MEANVNFTILHLVQIFVFIQLAVFYKLAILVAYLFYETKLSDFTFPQILNIIYFKISRNLMLILLSKA